MPYQIKKVSSTRYQVSNPKTGKIHAKKTTLQKAKSQVRLLTQIEKKTQKKL